MTFSPAHPESSVASRPDGGCVATFIFALLLICTGGVLQAQPILRFPSTSCSTSLQDCIDRSASGGIVEIATNSPIPEGIRIQDSLTLRPAPGFSPVIGSTSNLQVRVLTRAVASNRFVTIEGIRFVNTEFFSSDGETSGHILVVVDNEFEHSDPDLSVALLFVELAKNSNAIISGNRLRTPSFGIVVIAAFTNGFPVGVQIDRNSVEGFADPIEGIAFHGLGTLATVAIRSNLITGINGTSTRAGLRIVSEANSHVEALVHNNTIHGVNAHAFNVIVNDTASCTLHLANNIAARSNGSGYHIEDLSSDVLTISNIFNASFGNALPDEFSGLFSGVAFTADPRFADAVNGDFRLRSNSPYIDRGHPSPAGGLPSKDVAGQPRVVGQVDLGAHENSLIFSDGFESGGLAGWSSGGQ